MDARIDRHRNIIIFVIDLTVKKIQKHIWCSESNITLDNVICVMGFASFRRRRLLMRNELDQSRDDDMLSRPKRR